MTDYFDQLKALRLDSIARDVPNVSIEVGTFLYQLVLISKPKRILEIGTANAVSTLFLAKAAKEIGAHIDTMEHSIPGIAEAKINIAHFSMEDAITLWEGDAKERMKELTPGYDLIFIDAMKKHTHTFFEMTRALASETATFVIDDVIKFQEKMAPFFEMVSREELVHTILPIDGDDGIMVLHDRTLR